jgi:hypothetical protein
LLSLADHFKVFQVLDAECAALRYTQPHHARDALCPEPYRETRQPNLAANHPAPLNPGWVGYAKWPPSWPRHDG